MNKSRSVSQHELKRNTSFTNSHTMYDQVYKFGKPAEKSVRASRLIKMEELSFPKIASGFEISRLGLSLRPACKNAKHKRTLISHACVSAQCKEKDRLGCAYCFSLGTHRCSQPRVVQIEELLEDYETSCFQQLQNLRDIQQGVEMTENPGFLQKIFRDIDELRDQVTAKLEELKDKIREQTSYYTRKVSQNINGDIRQRIKAVEIQMQINRKQFFDLGNREIDFVVAQVADNAPIAQGQEVVQFIQSKYHEIDQGVSTLSNNVLQILKENIYPTLEIHQELPLYELHDIEELKQDKSSLVKLETILMEQIQIRQQRLGEVRNMIKMY